MPWSRLDDTWYDHPKVMRLPARIRNAGAGLRDRALSWSNRHLADGHVPNAVLRSLDCTPELRGALIGVGLFEDEGDGVYIHDYPEFNETKAELLDRRTKAAESGRLGGLAKKRNAKPSPSEPPSARNGTGYSDDVAIASGSPYAPLENFSTNARARNAPAIAPPPGRVARPGPSPIPDKRRESPSSDSSSEGHSGESPREAAAARSEDPFR